MVNWSKMRCKQGKATRRKRYKFVTLNIYCFYTFKNIRECQRGNSSKAIDHWNIATVSRDLSRLRTSRAIMLCGKELVNTCVRAEMRLICRHPCICFVFFPCICFVIPACICFVGVTNMNVPTWQSLEDWSKKFRTTWGKLKAVEPEPINF